MHDTQASIVQRISKDHDLQRRRFAETLEHLCTARAALDLADTLVVENGEVVRWFTSSRDHGVVAKSTADLHRIPIKRAFVKACLRLESNVSRKLALLHQVRENGETAFRILHDLEFNATLCNPNAREWMTTRFVTRHVAGKFGPTSATHACRFSRAATRLQTYVRFYRPPQFFFGTELTPDEMGLQFPLEHHMLHCVKELSSPCNQLVQELTMRVVHAIEASSSHQVVHIQTDFVLTANDDLVLVRVAEIVYTSDVRKPPQQMALASKPVVATRRPFSCPGAFCMDHPQGSCANDDDETTYAVAKKSIVWADHESHLLMRAQGTTTMYQSDATNQALVVVLAQSYTSIEKIEVIEKLLARRNTVLEQLQWFSKHGPALETTLPMDDLYNSVRVCADCCTMYQKLDKARRHRSSRPRKEPDDVRVASARVMELATPKHRPKSSGAPSVEKRRLRDRPQLSKCLSGPAPFWRPPDESPPPSRSTTPLPMY